MSIAETQARECFHTTGPGRPPRNPLGLLRAFIVMRMKAIRSLRELARLLDIDLVYCFAIDLQANEG